MRRLASLAAVAGAILVVGLVARAGVAPVKAALAASAWGLAAATVFHLVPMAASARGLQALVGRRPRRRFTSLLRLVWLREAVNGLLPVARVGGEVIAVRGLARRGVHPAAAAASVVVDVTVSLATQAAFTAAGLALLALRHPGSALAGPAWLGLGVAAPLVPALALAQRRGAARALGGIAHRVLGERWFPIHAQSRRFDRALRALWAHHPRLLRCAAWQLVAWTAAAGELWIFLRAAGAHVAVADAVLVEALVQAAASSAFVVPGALGVQEGAFLVLGGTIGLPPGVALAAALSRRARDVLLFLPALAWEAARDRRTPARAPGQACRGPRDGHAFSEPVRAAVPRWEHRMGILDSLLGQGQGQGTGQPSATQDLLQRFEQGQGSDEEAHGVHQEVAQRLPPDHYREAAEQALSRLSPEDRASLLSELQAQARKQDVNVPGLHEEQGSPAPGALANLFSSMHQQQPGMLQQLLGGGGGGGAFSSPVAKAAMLGIAAMGMRKLMGGPRW